LWQIPESPDLNAGVPVFVSLKSDETKPEGHGFFWCGGNDGI
jgi:hypothetical protein